MIAANNPEIDVNQLQQRIRDELARPPADRAAPSVPPTPGLTSPVPPRPAVMSLLPQKPAYTLRDFLDFHDEAFVVNAYRGVLRRDPDPTGMDNFLGKLRNGDYTKIEILGRLRFSPEGRRRGVRIRGLALPFAVHTASRLPVVGYGIAWLNAIARLPVFIKNWQRFEAHIVHGLDQQQRADLERLRALTDEKAGQQQIVDLRQRLQDATAQQQDALVQTQQHFQDELSRAATGQQALLESQKTFLLDALRDLRRQIFDQKRTLLDQQRRLGLLLEEARKRLPAPLDTEQLTTLLGEDERLLDAMYATFEDQFRGTREDIKTKQRIYLPLVRDCQAGTDDAPILDIGCGRGEWLELLRDEGLTAHGVDLNRLFVEQCQENQLAVIEQDAIACLRGLPRHALGAITGFHIIEHLPIRTLIALFDEALRVLRPGGVAIFETPNPGNVLVGSCNFYLDPTHRHPLPSPLTRYLIEARGFVRVEIRELNPVDVSQHLTEGSPALIGPLNHYFFGPQDYAVIAWKA